MVTNNLHLWDLLRTEVGSNSIEARIKAKFIRLLLFLLPGLLLNSLMLPRAIALQQAIELSVVRTKENDSQWAGITTRLQAAGVGYCVIYLPSVKNAADLGNTTVLFLPNVTTLTPTQVVALNDWIKQGGHIIASGPVGSLSDPEVRQILRSILGAYWGFSLNTPTKLAPLRTSNQEAWLHSAGLSGTVNGGVVIPTSLTSQPAATWQSKSNAPAVVTTDQATTIGWNWGVDAVSSAPLDTAWLKVLLEHYLQYESVVTTPTCPAPGKVQNVASSPPIKPATKPQPKPPTEIISLKPPAPVAQATIPASPTKPQPKITAPAPLTAPVDSATPSAATPKIPKVNSSPLLPLAPLSPPPSSPSKLSGQLTFQGLEVAPSTKEPVSDIQAIALPQELENLIGRFESAKLAAEAKNLSNGTKVATNNVNSSSLEASQSTKDVLAQAREIGKDLPQLISQQNYTAARQQWLKAQQLLWTYYPIDRSLAQPEIRAMWLDRETIVRAGSEQRLAIIFDQLAAAGINTVFFETINAGYPIYPSRIAPQQNPLVRGWDPLAAAVKLAHQRGMELHAWVWTFAVGNREHNRLVNLPDDYPGPVLSAHPDWASYDNRGSLFPPGQGKPFLDPANPEARRYLLQLYDEIVSRYQVDGLQLDYIRYPFQDPAAERSYGYGMAARQIFNEMAGVDPAQISPRNPEIWQKWTDFRAQQIDSFVAQVSQMLRQKRPRPILSVAVYPFSENERLQKLQQHWEVWARRGDIDLVVPMTYALDTYRFQRLAQPWLSSTDLGSTLLLPGIRLFNLPSSVAVDQIQLVRDLPVSGYSLFAVHDLNAELKIIFQKTQGTSQNTPQEPIPYRQPFLAAAARFEALEQEWNFLLAKQQLWVREPEFSLWRTQTKNLQTILNQLAAAPSFSRSAMARAELTAFVSNFQNWMRLQALDHPYQVNVWLNRLNTLETLLRYGDRVVLQQQVPIAQQRSLLAPNPDSN